MGELSNADADKEAIKINKNIEKLIDDDLKYDAQVIKDIEARYKKTWEKIDE